ncbi:hypothetical protein GCM10010524_52510 [Streptomyces mexicanus]
MAAEAVAEAVVRASTAAKAVIVPRRVRVRRVMSPTSIGSRGLRGSARRGGALVAVERLDALAARENTSRGRRTARVPGAPGRGTAPAPPNLLLPPAGAPVTHLAQLPAHLEQTDPVKDR